MRVLISLAVFMIFLTYTNADEQNNNELTVTVRGIEGLDGQLSIGLYNSETDWTEEDKVFKGIYIKIISDTITYTFKDLSSGIFAIALFHDENSNEKLDKGLFKIPKEGYAFSNNVFGSFGPPEFTNASFILNGNKKIEIEMHY